MWQWFFRWRHIFAFIFVIFFVYWLFFMNEGIYWGTANYVILVLCAFYSIELSYRVIKEPERRWGNMTLFVLFASMTVKQILLIFFR